jgi:PAS domain S-box-containing protein
MITATINLSAAGTLSVAFIALFFSIFQGWLCLKKSGFSWNKWGAAISAATFLFALAVFFQFNSLANWTNRVSELVQYSTFILLVHSVYGFTFAYLKIDSKRYHQIAGLWHAMMLVVLWSTKLVLADGFVNRHFLWLENPYIEPELGPLGPYFLIYLAGAGVFALNYWLKYRSQAKTGANAFILGFIFWAALALHDVSATLGINRTIQFFMEYGFLGFSASIISVTFKEYVELYEVARKSREDLQNANEKLELRVDQRTAKLEKTNQELLTEIRQRKWALSALRESEERFRTAFHTSPDAVNINTISGEFVEINEGFTILTGYTRADVIGNTTVGVDMWSIPAERQKLLDGLNQNGYVTNFEYLLRCKDGSTKNALISARVINLKGENHILAITRDISKWKAVENEKRKLELQLRRAERMEAIGTLAGGVAHDLNNILSGIVGYPELLLMDLAEDSPLRESLLTIQNSGEKAAAIVQDLLTLARRGVAISEVINLNKIVTDHLQSPEYEKIMKFHAGVQVETDLQTDLLNISGSPLHLSKTVMNLVSNAAEAMPSGGEIAISTKNMYVDQPIGGYDDIEEGDYAVLTITDSGIGIRPEDKERIFEPFYTKKVMGRSGTGLGMAVVWGTLKDHHGYVDLQSTEGKGTTFTLYFPVTREAMQPDATHFSINDQIGNGESILVVDDIETQRKIACLMLSKLGYSVQMVSSGEEAIEYMKNNSADLVVLDMIMDPGIDGLATFRGILDLHPNQKAIIASGFSETDRVKEAQSLGAGEYVRKPYTIEKIAHAVKAELAR